MKGEEKPPKHPSAKTHQTDRGPMHGVTGDSSYKKEGELEGPPGPHTCQTLSAEANTHVCTGSHACTARGVGEGATGQADDRCLPAEGRGLRENQGRGRGKEELWLYL